MTNQEIKTVGQTIAQETQIGGNTAARVGGVVEGIGVALDNKDAANGYYQATISGGTITVNAPNYLLGSGGNLRIKMPSEGTTASTLTIGNANTVQLWYNGAAVSAQNTWEANEIISVFYDGTRFMASNSQGGGGKAQKISYDNSQSGLAAENVQGALDEIEDELTVAQAVDLSILRSVNYGIWSGKWHSNSVGIFTKAMSVIPNQKYKVTHNGNFYADFWYFAQPQAPSNNVTVNYTGHYKTNTYEDVIITIPSGVYYLVIQDDSAQTGGTTKIPQTFELLSESKQDIISNSSNIEELQDALLVASEQYTAADCVNVGILQTDGVVYAGQSSFRTSNLIEIPDNAIAITYNDIYFNNAYTYCGLCLYDSSNNVIWFNYYSTEGKIKLSEYPNARYIRFMGATGGGPVVSFMKQAEGLSSINGSDDLRKYGTIDVSPTYSTYHSSLHFCSLDSPCLEDGELQTVYGRFINAGNLIVYIGFIDQNNFLIIRDTFNITVTSGACTVDVSSRHIKLKTGEYLFYDATDGSVNATYGIDTSIRPVGIVANASMAYSKLSDGVYWCFGWTVNTHKASITEMQDELNDIQNELSEHEERITALENNKKYYIDDELNGMTYLLASRNGVLQLIPSVYHKVAILGNSLVKHGIKKNTWWGEWGMAATKQEYDLVHVIEEGLQVKYANVQCVCKNISAWETNFTTDKATLLADVLSLDTDLVVFRLGENVKDADVSSFYNAYCDMIDYIYTVCPSVKIVMTGLFWVIPNKEEIVESVARDKHIDFVKINQLYATCQEAVGHYVYGADGGIHKITVGGVANHPSNVGMAAIANAVLTTIGYDRVNKTYSLQEVTVGGVTGTMWVLNE